MIYRKTKDVTFNIKQARLPNLISRTLRKIPKLKWR